MRKRLRAFRSEQLERTRPLIAQLRRLGRAELEALTRLSAAPAKAGAARSRA